MFFCPYQIGALGVNAQNSALLELEAVIAQLLPQHPGVENVIA